VGGSQPFYLAYRPADITALLSRYGDLICAEAAIHWQPGIAEAGSVRPPRERVRIAVVSGQVRQHPVWDVVLRGIVAHLDRRRFEVVLEGAGAERYYREKLIRLPGTGVCTDLTPVQSQPWDSPARQWNCVRFALCQQAIKFDPADDVLLTRIAKTVGPCEFWLAAPRKLHWTTARLRNRLAAVFRAEGLDPDAHLREMPWLPRDQFAGFLDEMDVFLDCSAFSGYTTAWQAIHRGIPTSPWKGNFCANAWRQACCDRSAWRMESPHPPTSMFKSPLFGHRSPAIAANGPFGVNRSVEPRRMRTATARR
jgi:predicted O-linked N-acetylglucosamine transferase (SPINDLY family)